jgi:tRNA (mo5U34)-methyltransferase
MRCAIDLRPWKKGPLSLFGVEIDTEWRSDWKWERIQPHLPAMEGKTVCDLGCGNGYFMFRMLEHKPRVVVGIDLNLHAWLEFQAFKRFSGVSNLHFELLRGDSMQHFPNTFDVVFCLGVLYHTPDPVGMLRGIRESMTKGGHLIVDCSGIPGDESMALFPKKRYAGMSGVYFLPTLATLKIWLQRAQFVQHQIIFAEKLSTEEQRITEWAPVNTSLKECLDPTDDEKTIEGYPAPHRFYLRAKRG